MGIVQITPYAEPSDVIVSSTKPYERYGCSAIHKQSLAYNHHMCCSGAVMNGTLAVHVYLCASGVHSEATTPTPSNRGHTQNISTTPVVLSCRGANKYMSNNTQHTRYRTEPSNNPLLHLIYRLGVTDEGHQDSTR